MARPKGRRFATTTAPTASSPTYKTWIYARISSENVANEDSVNNQIEIAKEYIESDNSLVLCGTFSDSGYSVQTLTVRLMPT